MADFARSSERECTSGQYSGATNRRLAIWRLFGMRPRFSEVRKLRPFVIDCEAIEEHGLQLNRDHELQQDDP